MENPVSKSPLSRSSILLVLLTISGEAGCLDPATRTVAPPRAAESAQDIAAGELEAAAAGRTYRGIEDDILRLENRVPGIGGLFIDSTGNLVVLVRNLSQEADALAALASMPGNFPRSIDDLVEKNAVTVRSAQFSFSQLVAWEKLLFPRLTALRGFLGIDANEAENRVVIRLTQDASQNAAITLVTSENVPLAAVQFEIGSPATFQHALTARVRPISAGYQIQSDAIENCTLGWNVYATGVGEGFLTASHCGAGPVGTGAVNDYIHQPTRGAYPYTQNRLGFVHTNPAWTRTDSECGGVSLCALADVMFVKFQNTPADTGVKRLVKTDWVATNYGVPTIEANRWFINLIGVADAASGSSVDKVGMTTGWTRGTVFGTCVNEVVDGSVILCSDKVTGSRTGPGDSGAPVFFSPSSSAENAPILLAGIYYAGTVVNGQTCTTGCTYWFSRWTKFATHLGLALCPLPFGCLPPWPPSLATPNERAKPDFARPRRQGLR
jgi:hypothetical protein